MEETNLQLAALEAELSASQRHLQNCRASLEHEQARLRVASDTIQRQVFSSTRSGILLISASSRLSVCCHAGLDQPRDVS
eukprot:COSAG01_NODE_1184_length_11346_cov_58.600249_5_plen_80_part_00